jgi:hypothetical protein
MPVVNGKHYSYTPAGKKAAEEAKKKRIVSAALNIARKAKK